MSLFVFVVSVALLLSYLQRERYFNGLNLAETVQHNFARMAFLSFFHDHLLGLMDIRMRRCFMVMQVALLHEVFVLLVSIKFILKGKKVVTT